jgi:hypothetical protein
MGPPSTDIVIRWTAPVSGGSPITSYQVLIRQSDGTTFTEELTYCDGSDPAITAALQCSIPSAVLNSSPYNIEWGQGIWAKVAAINAYGISAFSNEGNGGIIITNPDAPINFVEDLSERTLNAIGFSWD